MIGLLEAAREKAFDAMNLLGLLAVIARGAIVLRIALASGRFSPAWRSSYHLLLLGGARRGSAPSFGALCGFFFWAIGRLNQKGARKLQREIDALSQQP